MRLKGAIELATRLPIAGHCARYPEGRVWGVTVKRSADRKHIWLYAEDLAGSDIVSFNLYGLKGAGLKLKPCEMSAFVLGFDIGPSSPTGAA